MSVDNYFIKEGYVARKTADTREQEAGDYWTPNKIQRALSYQWQVYRLALDHAPQGGSLIDLGCGVGVKLARLKSLRPDLELIGYDQPTAVAKARQLFPEGDWRAIDLAEVPQPGDECRAEVVVCADVVEHVLDPDRVLGAIKAKMAPGGIAVISTPDRDRLRGPDNMYSPLDVHVREWNASEFRAFIESRGFEVLSQHFFLPGKPGLSAEIWWVMAKQLLCGLPLRYNQALVVRSL